MILETEAFLNRALARGGRSRVAPSDTISAAEVQASRDVPEPLFVVFISPWTDELRELLVTNSGLTLPLAARVEGPAREESRPAAIALPTADIDTPHWLEIAVSPS
jgi:hypothetical protein